MLFLTATPDDRLSTSNLALLVDEIDHRPLSTATLWYLRTANHLETRPGAKVVDSLRTWSPAASLDRMGLGTLAGWLRGARLRSWLKRVHPDVVVLDDGLGRRVIESVRPAPRLVIRLNEQPPDDLDKEDPPATVADLVIAPASSAPPSPGGSLTLEEPVAAQRSRAAARFASAPTLVEERRRLRLPENSALVVGWGDDGWLDGPELFVRTLWALEQRHHVVAHGAWFGLTADPHEVERFHREAERCGVGDRFHQRDADTIHGRMCGDVAFLPYRSTANIDDVLEVTCSGSLVVAFAAAGIDDPLVRTVPDLDVEHAAAEIAEGLDCDRRQFSAAARARFEPGPADDILSLH